MAVCGNGHKQRLMRALLLLLLWFGTKNSRAKIRWEMEGWVVCYALRPGSRLGSSYPKRRLNFGW